MKKLLLLSTLFILFTAQVSWGQVSKTLEGLAIDSKGIPLPDGSKDVTFFIYETIDDELPLWSEQQNVLIQDGRFATTLGQVTALDDLAENETYWLTMKVGQGKELSPRLELNLGENDETNAKSALVGNTLDLAYDEGGAGTGRTITADAGAVHILGSDGAVPSFPAIGGKDFLVSENNGNSNISIIGGAANSSALKFFPSGATGNVGVINYNYANDQMSFGTLNGTTRMTIDAANGVGIGTVAPNGKLGIAQVTGTARWLDILGDSNAEVSISIQPQNTNTTGLARGLSIVLVMKASAAGTAGYGVQIDTQPQANLNGFSYGTLAIAQLSNSSSSVTNYFPMFFRFDTKSTYSGAIDTVDVFRIESPVLKGSKPSNITGLNIANQGATSITNAYGLRVSGQSGATNNWNIYSEGASSRNFFEGNVGIGTETPGAKLEVTGQVKITGGTPGAGKVLTSDVTGLASWQTPTGGGNGGSIADADNDTKVQTEESADEDKIRFDTNGVQRMIINTNGRVGIGTSNPATIFTINEDALDGTTSLRHRNTASASVNNEVTLAHRLETTSTARPAFSIKSSFNNITDGSRNSLVNFSTAQSGTFQEALTLDGANIGIGTTSPQALLHMKGDFDALRFETGLGGSAGLHWYENSTAEASIVWDASPNKMMFSTGGLFGANAKMVIQEDGTVGIGDLSPDALLQVKDTSLNPGSATASDYHFFIETGTANGDEAGIGFGNNNVGAAIIYEDQGSQSRGDLVFYTKSSSTAGVAPEEEMRITANGLLGINTATPDAALSVNGDVRLGSGSGLGTNIFVDASPGRIGMGTDTPANFLHVLDGQTGSGIGTHTALIENDNNLPAQHPVGVLALKINQADPDDQHNYITFYDVNDNAEGRIEGTSGGGGINLKSGGADFAELLPRRNPGEDIEASEIVAVVDGEITKNTIAAQQLMVISTAPVVTGNSPGEDKEDLHEQVAFIGQVPVKVRGVVQAGDYIIPSGFNDGTGLAVAPDKITAEQISQIVGQAWESSNETGLKKINTLVGLNRPELMVGKLMKKVQNQENELEALKKQVGQLQSAVQSLLTARKESKNEKMYARK